MSLGAQLTECQKACKLKSIRYAQISFQPQQSAKVRQSNNRMIIGRSRPVSGTECVESGSNRGVEG